MLLGEQLSWIFGIISNVFWIFVFVPQFYKNYQSKNAEGISLFLLFGLMLGDSFSIISASLKNVSLIIIYSGVYHIILGIIIILQILFYRRKLILNVEESEPLLDISTTRSLYSEIFSDYEYMYLHFNEFIFFIFMTCIIFSTLFVSLLLKDNIISEIIGWLATFVFVISRVPQIILNFKRKSTNGLSLLSFIIINFANFFFLSSILIVLLDLQQHQYIEYLKNNAQWISGCIFSSLFDIVIFYQFVKYKAHPTINLID